MCKGLLGSAPEGYTPEEVTGEGQDIGLGWSNREHWRWERPPELSQIEVEKAGPWHLQFRHWRYVNLDKVVSCSQGHLPLGDTAVSAADGPNSWRWGHQLWQEDLEGTPQNSLLVSRRIHFYWRVFKHLLTKGKHSGKLLSGPHFRLCIGDEMVDKV